MTESLGWWSPPVPVKGERIGITRNVSNAVEALRIMSCRPDRIRTCDLDPPSGHALPSTELHAGISHYQATPTP